MKNSQCGRGALTFIGKFKSSHAITTTLLMKCFYAILVLNQLLMLFAGK